MILKEGMENMLASNVMQSITNDNDPNRSPKTFPGPQDNEECCIEDIECSEQIESSARLSDSSDKDESNGIPGRVGCLEAARRR